MLAAQGIIVCRRPGLHPKGHGPNHTEIEAGAFEWKLDLEDVHLNIEARLTQLVGDAGKRLHTGRSRNDQVATDVRLWLRGEIDLIDGLLADLQKALVDIAEKNVEVILPGFTHLQVAQPVSFGHHMLAYVEMFARDAERLADVRRRVNLPAAGCRCSGRHQLPAGPRARGPAWAWSMRKGALRLPEQPGRRERPRLRH
jgi:argininosuccinate lyase